MGGIFDAVLEGIKEKKKDIQFLKKTLVKTDASLFVKLFSDTLWDILKLSRVHKNFQEVLKMQKMQALGVTAEILGDSDGDS